ncbi:ferrous iron transport protein B [Oribacterium sp. WCC10]|uniref:ferrous iron transport protein B n=1 Tax=Oribacterium sp. WCC10 TaxID=1855343 RepID=UPI0008E4F2E0|nr:ferrous iron transport protein B [Oribacterium sp. WCC10]SFG14085.1 ferrous iron transport protein B [Oribacterium sp. WCC10]
MEIKIALAGNPNCGKTTLFNALTGSNQYVGNWPGVTVEKKEGRLRGNREVIIQDLPGIYSLSPYTLEEVVSRNYLVNDKPDVILNIIDGTNIERNLYLTTQLVEIGIPMVIAVNMMDVVRKNGDKVDIEKLSQELGCKFVEISALRGEGIDKISELCLEAAKSENRNSLPSVFDGSVEHAIAHIEEHLEGMVPEKNLRWFAVKVFERDSVALEQISINEGTKKDIEAHIADCEKELDDDAESIITNQRYNYIKKLVDKAVVKKRKAGELSVSDKIDQIVTNRILALPIFAVVMFLVYYISVTTLGTVVTDWTNDVFVGEWIQPFFENLLTSAGASDWVISLVVDGIIGGLGAPLGFAPQMAIVFFFLTILEDCGYMARVAFIMDRLFRRFGLSGKSFIPFLISSGCGVPGIMATRTIEEEKDRRMTMITTTSIPCGAKLPVIAVIAGYLMGGAWWFAPTIYFAGIAMVIIMCIIMKKTNMFSGDPAPFVMELPAYHIPSAKNVFLHVWERVWAFLKKAGTILFLCCAVMWFLGAFGIVEGAFTLVENVEDSFLASIGNVFAWMFAPIGFGSWQAVAASLSGFVAKEGLVTTLSVVSSLGEELEEYDEAMNVAFRAFFPTSMAAVSFLIFNIFDSPCLAAISAMAKEIGSRKWFWFAIAFQNINAYLICLMVYQLIGLMVGQVAFSVFTVAAVLVLAGYLYLLFRPDPNARKAVSGVKPAMA